MGKTSQPTSAYLGSITPDFPLYVLTMLVDLRVRRGGQSQSESLAL